MALQISFKITEIKFYKYLNMSNNADDNELLSLITSHDY